MSPPRADTVRIAASISPLGIILSTTAPDAEALRAAIAHLLACLDAEPDLAHYRMPSPDDARRN